jgi:cell volume regulation protein A
VERSSQNQQARRFRRSPRSSLFGTVTALQYRPAVVHDAELILLAGGLLTVAVAASVLAARVRLPALVLFVGLGMLVGSDGLGWIAFDDYELARLLGTIALVLILFEGGLGTGWRQIRPLLRPALNLALVGTAVTAAIAGLAASWLFGRSLLEGLLLGAILSATDGAAVFTLLRGTHLPRHLARTLEGEAGFNDPVAVLLVLLVIEVILKPHYGVGDAILFFAREVAIGAGAGVLVGLIARFALTRVGGIPSGLVVVTSVASAAIAFGSAGALGGSGFLAVYLVGLNLGDAPLPDRRSMLAFHEGLATLAEIGMFLALGLLVFPSQLGDIADKGIVLALIVAVVARPVAATIATFRESFNRGERLLLGWAGLRGAVPVILATFPIIRHVPRSLEFFNIVFFAVLFSAALQGLTINALASRLGVVVREHAD